MTGLSRRRRGANAIEFAMLLPVFVSLVGAGIEIGWMLFQQGAVRTAVTHGCRVAAMVDPGPEESNLDAVYSLASEKLKNEYAASGGLCDACTVTVAAVGTVPHRSLQCTLRAPYVGLTALFPGDPPTLADQVTLRFEHQRRIE